MKKGKLSLRFEDNPVPIEFSLFHNTVFYGLNGSGKTRILKTILSLQQIMKDNRYTDIPTMIKDLNLEQIKLNGVYFDELFEVGKKILKDKRKQLLQFIKDEKNALIFYVDLMREVTPLVLNQVPGVINRRLENFNKIGKTFVSDEKKNIEELEDFKEWLLMGKNLTRIIHKIMIGNSLSFEEFEEVKYKNKYSMRFEQLKDVDQYVNDQFTKKFRDFEFQSEQEKVYLEKEKVNITTMLGDLKVKYIPAYHESEENVFLELLDNYRKASEAILSVYWESKTDDSNMVKSEIVKMKLLQLNDVLARYGTITIFVDSKGYVIQKNKKTIEFNKLSSGEKRLISIFINIIFSDSTHVLVDEPEISMSVDFQNKLVVDMLQVCGDKVILIATHAPFILKDFQNFESNRAVKL